MVRANWFGGDGRVLPFYGCGRETVEMEASKFPIGYMRDLGAKRPTVDSGQTPATSEASRPGIPKRRKRQNPHP